jgi:hypothetical protein
MGVIWIFIFNAKLKFEQLRSLNLVMFGIARTIFGDRKMKRAVWRDAGNLG